MIKNKRLVNFLEQAPTLLKSSYFLCIQLLKYLLKKIGLLSWLDKKAKQNQKYHYIRSLFAIYQLEDLIQLDVPWWTYSAIDQVNQYLHNLNRPARVFEYGSGASTLWLAKRAEHVISIEHDKSWLDQLSANLNEQKNVNLLLIESAPHNEKSDYYSFKCPHFNFEYYVKSIRKFNQLFDLIVIDGRCRSACLKESLAFLKPDGLIVFDNSNRERYQEGLTQSQLLIKRFYGRVPGSPFPSETALLKRH